MTSGHTAVALAVHLHREQRLTVQGILLTTTAVLAMITALLGNLFGVPDAPYRYFPYVYAAYLGIALLWYWIAGRRSKS